MKKLCIIVPYRNREVHLKQFIPCIEKTLIKQKIDFEVLVVEQEEGKPFNRAKLFNCGFSYNDTFDYYCFHDVDLIPEISDYSYCESPTHLSAQVEQFNYKLPYEHAFGGVVIFNRESFLKVNGFSNDYWSWGCEDDDMYRRCRLMKLKIFRKECRYKSLAHDRNIDQNLYHISFDRLKRADEYFINNKIIEGLDTLEFILIEEKDITTHAKKIKVSI